MPYQIIHTFEGFLSKQQLDGMTVLLGRNEERLDVENIDILLEQRLIDLKEKGIDGIVVNVGGIGYLESREGWDLFLKGLILAASLDFKIWIYDEKGYPSGSAGGIVLKKKPQLEAKGIKHEKLKAVNGKFEFSFREKGDIKIICGVESYKYHSINSVKKNSSVEKINEWEAKRRIIEQNEKLEELDIYYMGVLYEGTHASRSFAEKRRYINLLSSEAVREFIKTTHERYREMLPEELFKKVDAFFTDEPSLMSVVMPEIDGTLTERIPVMDEPDANVPILPTVPYSKELEDILTQRYGLQLSELVPEIFSERNSPSVYKCIFWQAVSIVYEECYAKQMEEACESLGKRLTGHILCEDSPFENMIFHSNPFRILKHFHMPGVDLLSNKLQNINVFSHKLPFSSGFLKGVNGIMSETSDFAEQRFDGLEIATPAAMAAALSMQYVLGVREYSYYYDFRLRSKEEYAWANAVISRTCEFGKNFRPNPSIAIYCPYENFWSGYIPSSLELKYLLSIQLDYVKESQKDILQLCNELFYKNIQYIMVDESSIEELMQKNIRKVIIPKCRVISSNLMEAYDKGLVELYGDTVEFVFDDKEFKNMAGDFMPEAIEAIVESPLPFDYEEGALYESFEHDRFYIFNPTDTLLKIVSKCSMHMYDPFEDREETVKKDCVYWLPGGRAIFMCLSDV